MIIFRIINIFNLKSPLRIIFNIFIYIYIRYEYFKKIKQYEQHKFLGMKLWFPVTTTHIVF